MQEFELFLQEYPNHSNDHTWLMGAAVDLAAMFYEVSKKVSQAELDEARLILTYIDQVRDGKKMSVSEAERRVIADTNNAKHTLENTKLAIHEMIKAISNKSWSNEIEISTLEPTVQNA